MAKLRFAILQEVRDYDARIALEYDQDIALSKIQARSREHLTELSNSRLPWVRRKFTQPEIKEAIAKAFHDLVDEVKRQTVKLP